MEPFVGQTLLTYIFIDPNSAQNYFPFSTAIDLMLLGWKDHCIGDYYILTRVDLMKRLRLFQGFDYVNQYLRLLYSMLLLTQNIKQLMSSLGSSLHLSYHQNSS